MPVLPCGLELPFRMASWKTQCQSFGGGPCTPGERWLRADPPAVAEIGPEGFRSLWTHAGIWAIHAEGVGYVPDAPLALDRYLDSLLATRFLITELHDQEGPWRKDEQIAPWSTAPGEATECWLSETAEVGRSVIVRYTVEDGLVRESQQQVIDKQTLRRRSVSRSFDFVYDGEAPAGIFDEPGLQVGRPLVVTTRAAMRREEEHNLAARRAQTPWAWETEFRR